MAELPCLNGISKALEEGGVAPAVTPIVRIPPNQGQTRWVAKGDRQPAPLALSR